MSLKWVLQVCFLAMMLKSSTNKWYRLEGLIEISVCIMVGICLYLSMFYIFVHNMCFFFSSFVIDAWWIHVFIVSLVFLGICVFFAIGWLFNFFIHRDRPDWFYLFLYLMFIYFLDYRIYIIPFSAMKP